MVDGWEAASDSWDILVARWYTSSLCDGYVLCACVVLLLEINGKLLLGTLVDAELKHFALTSKKDYHCPK